jgi:hypothetical protein
VGRTSPRGLTFSFCGAESEHTVHEICEDMRRVRCGEY